MRKKELAQGMIQYVFEPDSGNHFGNRVTALINEDKVMLIDTGYTHEGIEILEDFAAKNLKVEKIIITHFHNDHMGGLKAMTDVSVYGSSYYKNTLDRWTPVEEHRYFTPTVPVEKPSKLQFGRHEIEMIPFPGHSICTLLVKINDEYVHIADELMFSEDGEPLLPCITKEDVKRQFESVNKLKDYIPYTFIPGHGDPIKDQDRLQKEIENVSLYLGAILNNEEEITVEEAIKGCSSTFLHKEWHENVYK